MDLKYELYIADARDIIGSFDNNSIDLVVTSPPYYDMIGEIKWHNYEEFMFAMKQIFKEIYRVIKAGRVVAVNVPCDYKRKGKNYDIGIDFYNMMTSINFKSAEKIIWQKPSGYGGAHSCMKRFGNFIQRNYPFYYLPDRSWEFIWIMSKGRVRKPKITKEVEKSIVSLGPIQKRASTSIWSIPTSGAERKINGCITHPAMFNVELSNLVIQLYSLVGDVVLDPFAGSGTVGLSARKYNRNCILIEKERKYKELIKKKVGWYQNNLYGKNTYIVRE